MDGWEVGLLRMDMSVMGLGTESVLCISLLLVGSTGSQHLS